IFRSGLSVAVRWAPRVSHEHAQSNPDQRRSMQFRKVIVVVAVCAAATIVATTPRPGVDVRHRASLSDDLRAFAATHSTKVVRVIAHGTDQDLHIIAARHGVHVARVLNGGADLEANSSPVE